MIDCEELTWLVVKMFFNADQSKKKYVKVDKADFLAIGELLAKDIRKEFGLD